MLPNMEITHIIVLHLLGLIIIPSLCDESLAASPTTSPMSEFVVSPRNITVLEGHPAVLRCKVKDTVHNCQWFYLEFGLDMLDSRTEPVLVKEFRPTKSTDCSIKFSQARLIQAGQWICKGLQIHARKYVVSKPAFVKVIRISGSDNSTVVTNTEAPEETEEELSSDIIFELTNEGHIVNTQLKDTAVLGCHANRELKSCSWIKPDGITLKINDANDNYIIHENFTSGNCSLLINEVSDRDEGNWRCIVSAENMNGKTLGPLIHLHVLEFGPHAEAGIYGFTRENEKGNYLIEILVSTSAVLAIIIIALVIYMYRNVWRRNAPPHSYLEPHMSGSSEYSHYGSTRGWLAGIEPKDQKLIDDSVQMNPNDDPATAQYSRYLDMTGNGKREGYIMFPASSVRSSMSSRTTSSTIPVGHRAVHDSDHSARTSAAESLHSVATLGNPSLEANALPGRGVPLRQDSVCSEGHLYEEIDETKMRRKSEQEAPEYANIDEDQEGYMIPKRCSPENSVTIEEVSEIAEAVQAPSKESESSPKAPPYSKIGELGLVPDSEVGNIAANPTYSQHEETENPSDESYDVPNGPPVPLRNDSIDNALATYDVPKSSSTDTNPVFV